VLLNEFCAREGIQKYKPEAAVLAFWSICRRAHDQPSSGDAGLILILSPLPAAAITLAFGKPTDDGVINQIIDGAYLVDAET
jgi:hypothetical protein